MIYVACSSISRSFQTCFIFTRLYREFSTRYTNESNNPTTGHHLHLDHQSTLNQPSRGCLMEDHLCPRQTFPSAPCLQCLSSPSPSPSTSPRLQHAQPSRSKTTSRTRFDSGIATARLPNSTLPAPAPQHQHRGQDQSATSFLTSDRTRPSSADRNSPTPRPSVSRKSSASTTKTVIPFPDFLQRRISVTALRRDSATLPGAPVVGTCLRAR